MGIHTKPTLGFIGAGRVANNLAVALNRAGYSVLAISSRTLLKAERLADQIPTAIAVENNQSVADSVDMVFITTPDDVVSHVAEAVNWLPNQQVVHCSGALNLESLTAAFDKGSQVGSFHPVHTFSPIGSDSSGVFQGVSIGIEGDPPLLDSLSGMADDLGAFPIVVPAEARSLYHAGAVLVCGYFVALFRDALNLWQLGGLTGEVATSALAQLVKSTLENLMALGVEDSQSGPIPRGDMGTVKRHVKILHERAPELLGVYSALAERALDLAVKSGRQDSSSITAWKGLIEDYQHSLLSN